MSRTILSRLGAGVIAATLVAGGSLLVAAPASAANDEVFPKSVVENTWGPEGVVTITGTGTPGDELEFDIVDSNVIADVTKSYLSTSAVIDAVVAADGTYSISFSLGDTPETSDFSSFPLLGETVFAALVNSTQETEPVFLPIEVTAFVADPNPVTTIVPTCLTGVEAQTTGVEFASTGYAQFEENVTYSVKDAGGTVVGNSTVEVDETGTARDAIRVFTTINGVEAGPIADGVYSITVTNGTVGSFAFFTVGNCSTPAPVVPAVPVVPAAVVPAAPQLANTGSSDAGILVGGSALLMLVGAALVVARRRQNAAA
jgi:LPXTG-motif cell wall-anchored protein